MQKPIGICARRSFMNWLDIVILVILVVSIFSGIKQGLIKSVLSLIGVIIGLVLASNFYQQVGNLLGFIPNIDIANIVAFILIMAVVIIAASIVAWVLRAIIKTIMLGWVDKLGGGVFGVLMGALGISAILAVIIKFTGTSIVSDSALAAFLLDKFPMVLGFLPGEFDMIRDFFN